MLTREDAIERVKKFTKELIETGMPLDKVILFGSYAKNSQQEYSDIDVALVSTIFSGFGFEDRKYFSNINNKKSFIDIETKTYPSNYFLKGDPFIVEINKTGIEIYSKS
jgi:uncharacterized protein